MMCKFTLLTRLRIQCSVEQHVFKANAQNAAFLAACGSAVLVDVDAIVSIHLLYAYT